MDIKERLKTLKIDSLYQTSLTEELAKSWQRNDNIKHFLADEIRSILKEIYEPLGMWGQNPREPEKFDEGVIIDNDWSPLMQADTHWTGHTIIINRCNKWLVNLYRQKGIESIVIDGTTFSYKEQIVFSFEDSENETIEKLKKILKIIRYKKNEIFLEGCEMYYMLIDSYNKTMGRGDEAQKFYEKDIYYFFPDIIEYKATKGRGDYNDRKQGIDIWKTHPNYKTTDQIKSVCSITPRDGGWFIDVAMSQKSRCDYYVFVCLESKIMVFNNDRDKIIFEGTGVFFPTELLHKEKKYEQ
jgi:hypothetical protein